MSGEVLSQMEVENLLNAMASGGQQPAPEESSPTGEFRGAAHTA